MKCAVCSVNHKTFKLQLLLYPFCKTHLLKCEYTPHYREKATGVNINGFSLWRVITLIPNSFSQSTSKLDVASGIWQLSLEMWNIVTLRVNVIIAFCGLVYLNLQECYVDYTHLKEIAVIWWYFGHMFQRRKLFKCSFLANVSLLPFLFCFSIK